MISVVSRHAMNKSCVWLAILLLPLSVWLHSAEPAARRELFDAVKADDLAKVTALLDQGGGSERA